MSEAPILVLDAGTSGIRAIAVAADGTVVHGVHRVVLPDSPEPGRVSFDAARQAAVAIELAREVVERCGEVAAVGITNQRASTIAWERATGRPVAPGIGWQDQRATDGSARLAAAGFIVSTGTIGPIASWLRDQVEQPVDDLCFGTVDTWLVWNLTGGARFVTDPTNVSAGMLWSADAEDFDAAKLAALDLPRSCFARVVDTVGELGRATVLHGAPPIVAIAGDQMAALAAHGDLRPGHTKVTFGTGAMLDLALGTRRIDGYPVAGHGSIPMVAQRRADAIEWMLEGAMFACGTNVEWLRDGLGLIDDVADSDAIAAECETSGGVVYVPALAGLGTPYWDFSAQGTFFGLARSTRRAHVVRAVLEGIAQRAADLVEAAEADSALTIERLAVDGGLVRNASFVQAVADATGRPVDVACDPEMTARGAALLAGIAIGRWAGHADVAAAWAPSRTVLPQRSFDRASWREACRRATALARPL